MTIRAFSYGGGIQSNAALVMAALPAGHPLHIDYQTFIFANVGNDSENPHTIEYVESVARPFAAAHGIEIVEVQKTLRDGTLDTIVSAMDRWPSGYVPIPVRSEDGAPMRRGCTSGFKIDIIDKELKRRGATDDAPAHVGIGISLDEFQRMKASRFAYKVNEYPLIDLRMSREDCRRVIVESGLPVPPKSSCFFCPFKTKADWIALRENDRDLFDRACEIEASWKEKRERRGLPVVWLTGTNKPLAEAFVDSHEQLGMFDADEEAESGCDNAGYCMI